MIDNGNILVNGKEVKSSYILKENDKIDIEEYNEEVDIVPENITLDIYYEDDDFIYSVCSHGYSLCSEEEPKKKMEKILFATDELTGLIWAAAKMRPSQSTKDMELSSLKKKFKDKK